VPGLKLHDSRPQSAHTQADAPPVSTANQTSTQGDVGAIRLLLRANHKLQSLAAADARLAAAAAAADDGSTTGLLGDVRAAADRYGKTPAKLVWDMQR
jgi:hypothetical protein